MSPYLTTVFSGKSWLFVTLIFTVSIGDGSGTFFPSTLPIFLIVPVTPFLTLTFIVNIFGVPGSTSTSPKSTLFPVIVACGFVDTISSVSGTLSVTFAVPFLLPLFVSVIV